MEVFKINKFIGLALFSSLLFFSFPEQTLAETFDSNVNDSSTLAPMLKVVVEPEPLLNKGNSEMITPYANLTVVRNTYKQKYNSFDSIWGGLYDITYKELSYRSGYDYLGYTTLKKDVGFFTTTYFYQDNYRTY